MANAHLCFLLKATLPPKRGNCGGGGGGGGDKDKLGVLAGICGKTSVDSQPSSFALKPSLTQLLLPLFLERFLKSRHTFVPLFYLSHLTVQTRAYIAAFIFISIIVD